MDRDRQSELMSAYLDGELTPAERVEAERLLETAPALRDELNDFARLSDLLRALPREEAPAELAAAIRREAERKSLLGSEPAAPRRSLVREIIIAVSAMAATVLAMLFLPQDVMPQKPSLVALAPGNVSFDAAPTPAEPRMSNADRFHGPADTNEGAEFAFGMTAETTPAASSLSMREAELKAPAAPGHDADMADALATSGDFNYRNAVQIGDVVPYFQTGVGVVQYVVVDLDVALDRLEVVLDRNGLSVPPEGSANLKKDVALGRSKGSPERKLDGEQQLMLVYVDAPRETITQVLNEMSQEPIFTQARLQPPVEAPEGADVALSDLKTEPADETSETSKIPAEQALVNDALVVTQNYSKIRQESASQSIAGDTNRHRLEARQDGIAGRAALPKMTRAASRMARNLHDLPVWFDDLPADALFVENSITPAYRRQRGAIALQLDSRSGEVQNNAVWLEQRPVAEARKDALGVQSKEAAGAEAVELGDQGLAEGLVEPTVRLLLVLQAPAAAPTP